MSATTWYQCPTVSGLMVTSDVERHECAIRAIDDFLTQDWEHKELIVLNATGYDLDLDSEFGNTEENCGCKISVFPLNHLDDSMWKFGLSQCSGEWVVDWQDDCTYSENYIRYLMHARHGKDTVKLKAYTGQVIDREGVILVDNTENKFSLSFRMAQTPQSTHLINSPELVTRYYATITQL